ncbi:MAG: hypothetical protein CME70_09045 [Halobacteriovorax sp.]|nr:hypothetical protein [Halobacteriovorax sp.]|tara:strand:- start:35534 stop:36769 length:1236 start_codon:yes stop_codon:yes gene_type:complete
MSNKKDNLCVLPWNHLFVTNTGDASFPCCSSQYSLGRNEKSDSVLKLSGGGLLKELSESKKNLREAFLKGEEPKICSGCYEKDREGIWSYRKTSNDLFPKTYDELKNKSLDLASPMKLEFIDLRLGNLCNLACRMCDAGSSRLLIDDYREYLGDENFGKELEGINWFSDRGFYKNLVENGKDIKIINMAGGEPFLIEESWEFLEMLIDRGFAKNIELRYNTNLTIIPEKAKKLWPKFKGVVLFLSIDGIDDVYEYIRYPAKWTKIEKNLEYLEDNFEDLNITAANIQMTVQAYNIANIPELTKYLQKFEKISKVPLINLLETPNELSFKSLPIDYRKEVAKKLKIFLMDIFDLKGLQKIDTYEDFLRNTTYLVEELLNEATFQDSQYQEFIRITEFFDNKRKQKLSDVLNL